MSVEKKVKAEKNDPDDAIDESKMVAKAPEEEASSAENESENSKKWAEDSEVTRGCEGVICDSCHN